MATMTTPELLDVFKNMTVLELNDFLKAFEEEFGVTAAAPVAVAAAPAAGGGEAAPRAEEKDEFDVILDRRGRQEDPGHQGGPGARRRPRPQGGQGPRRRRPEAGAREGLQGRRREGEGAARGGRRHRRAQVGATRAGGVATSRRAAPAPRGTGSTPRTPWPRPSRPRRGGPGPRRVTERVGEPVGDRARAGGRCGTGRAPVSRPRRRQDPRQRHLLRRVGGPDPLERLGVGLAVGAGARRPTPRAPSPSSPVGAEHDAGGAAERVEQPVPGALVDQRVRRRRARRRGCAGARAAARRPRARPGAGRRPRGR